MDKDKNVVHFLSTPHVPCWTARQPVQDIRALLGRVLERLACGGEEGQIMLPCHRRPRPRPRLRLRCPPPDLRISR